MDLVKGRGPIIWLFWGLALFFSLERFSLNLFFDKFLSFFFELLIQNFIIMLHNTLYGHSGGNYISKSSHPHIPLIAIFGAEHKQSLRGLHIKWIGPIFRQIFLINLTFWQIAIADIPERNHFLIGLNWLICFFICSKSLFSNQDTCQCKINYKVSLGVNG